MLSGIVVLDKPQGITSHDLVARTRKALGTKKVGHAGTLDPMATGLMILGINQGTKLLQYFTGQDKSYRATVVLGQATTTDDAEGAITSEADASGLSEQAIEQEMTKLRGEIMQVPASVSAIKVAGRRAHELARAGEEFELKSRPVTISRFERTGELRQRGKLVEFDVEVECSSGTYIRSLARDLGSALAVGGHLSALRRTRIGQLEVSAATTEASPERIIGLAQAAQLALPTIEVSEQDAVDLGFGRSLRLNLGEPTAAIRSGELVAVLDAGGKILTGFPRD